MGYPIIPGTSVYKHISLSTTNGLNIKADAGVLCGIVAHNINAAVRYLKLYDLAATPTVGTDTPVMTIAIPGATTGGLLIIQFAHPIAFANGIGIGLTTGVADNDTAAATANEQVINLLYV